MTIFSGRGLTSIHTVLLRMLKEECNKEKFKFNHTPLEDFTNCLWQRQPYILPIWIAYRLVLFIYYFGSFFIMIFCRPEGDYIWYKSLIFLSYWVYFIEIFAFGLAFAVTLEKFLKDKKKDPELPPREDTSELPIREKTPWHYKALWCLYTLSVSSALSVTIMFWFFLYDPEAHDLIGVIVINTILNSTLVVIDIFLNSIPFRFLHFYIPCALTVVYVTFTVIYQGSGGTGIRGEVPIHSILDWRKPKQASSTVAIFLACTLLLHCGMCVINIFKNWLKRPSESAE